MLKSEEVKKAKELDKKLRIAREEQGHNLAILAKDLNLSVVALVNLENANLTAFKDSLDLYLDSARAYSLKLQVKQISQISEPLIKIATHAFELDVPLFLKKKN